MRNIVTGYAFDKTAKTVTFPGSMTAVLERVLLIVNQTQGTIIYDPSTAGKQGTLAGNVLTLTWDTTAYANSDVLQIFVDDGDRGSTEESLASLVMLMTEFVERLDVYSDGAGRLQVALSNPVAQGLITSVGTLTTCSTVSSVTNMVGVGTGAQNLDMLWRLLMQPSVELQNSLFPVT